MQNTIQNKNENSPLKEELRKLKKDFGINDEKRVEEKSDEKKPNEKRQEWFKNPYVKVGACITGVIVIVWASQYVFAAFEGAIRQFKKLKKTIREK